jgi:hypothetical protein
LLDDEGWLLGGNRTQTGQVAGRVELATLIE